MASSSSSTPTGVSSKPSSTTRVFVLTPEMLKKMGLADKINLLSKKAQPQSTTTNGNAASSSNIIKNSPKPIIPMTVNGTTDIIKKSPKLIIPSNRVKIIPKISSKIKSKNETLVSTPEKCQEDQKSGSISGKIKKKLDNRIVYQNHDHDYGTKESTNDKESLNLKNKMADNSPEDVILKSDIKMTKKKGQAKEKVNLEKNPGRPGAKRRKLPDTDGGTTAKRTKLVTDKIEKLSSGELSRNGETMDEESRVPDAIPKKLNKQALGDVLTSVKPERSRRPRKPRVRPDEIEGKGLSGSEESDDEAEAKILKSPKKTGGEVEGCSRELVESDLVQQTSTSVTETNNVIGEMKTEEETEREDVEVSDEALVDDQEKIPDDCPGDIGPDTELIQSKETKIHLDGQENVDVTPKKNTESEDHPSTVQDHDYGVRNETQEEVSVKESVVVSKELLDDDDDKKPARSLDQAEAELRGVLEDCDSRSIGSDVSLVTSDDFQIFKTPELPSPSMKKQLKLSEDFGGSFSNGFEQCDEKRPVPETKRSRREVIDCEDELAQQPVPSVKVSGNSSCEVIVSCENLENVCDESVDVGSASVVLDNGAEKSEIMAQSEESSAKLDISPQNVKDPSALHSKESKDISENEKSDKESEQSEKKTEVSGGRSGIDITRFQRKKALPNLQMLQSRRRAVPKLVQRTITPSVEAQRVVTELKTEETKEVESKVSESARVDEKVIDNVPEDAVKKTDIKTTEEPNQIEETKIPSDKMANNVALETEIQTHEVRIQSEDTKGNSETTEGALDDEPKEASPLLLGEPGSSEEPNVSVPVLSKRTDISIARFQRKKVIPNIKNSQSRRRTATQPIQQTISSAESNKIISEARSEENIGKDESKVFSGDLGNVSNETVVHIPEKVVQEPDPEDLKITTSIEKPTAHSDTPEITNEEAKNISSGSAGNVGAQSLKEPEIVDAADKSTPPEQTSTESDKTGEEVSDKVPDEKAVVPEKKIELNIGRYAKKKVLPNIKNLQSRRRMEPKPVQEPSTSPAESKYVVSDVKAEGKEEGVSKVPGEEVASVCDKVMVDVPNNVLLGINMEQTENKVREEERALESATSDPDSKAVHKEPEENKNVKSPGVADVLGPLPLEKLKEVESSKVEEKVPEKVEETPEEKTPLLAKTINVKIGRFQRKRPVPNIPPRRSQPKLVQPSFTPVESTNITSETKVNENIVKEETIVPAEAVIPEANNETPELTIQSGAPQDHSDTIQNYKCQVTPEETVEEEKSEVSGQESVTVPDIMAMTDPDNVVQETDIKTPEEPIQNDEAEAPSDTCGELKQLSSEEPVVPEVTESLTREPKEATTEEEPPVISKVSDVKIGKSQRKKAVPNIKNVKSRRRSTAQSVQQTEKSSPESKTITNKVKIEEKLEEEKIKVPSEISLDICDKSAGDDSENIVHDSNTETPENQVQIEETRIVLDSSEAILPTDDAKDSEGGGKKLEEKKSAPRRRASAKVARPQRRKTLTKDVDDGSRERDQCKLNYSSVTASPEFSVHSSDNATLSTEKTNEMDNHTSVTASPEFRVYSSDNKMFPSEKATKIESCSSVTASPEFRVYSSDNKMFPSEKATKIENCSPVTASPEFRVYSSDKKTLPSEKKTEIENYTAVTASPEFRVYSSEKNTLPSDKITDIQKAILSEPGDKVPEKIEEAESRIPVAELVSVLKEKLDAAGPLDDTISEIINAEVPSDDIDDLMYPPPLEESDSFERSVDPSASLRSDEIAGRDLSGDEEYEEEPAEKTPKRRRKTGGNVGRRSKIKPALKDKNHQPRSRAESKLVQRTITSFFGGNHTKDKEKTEEKEEIEQVKVSGEDSEDVRDQPGDSIQSDGKGVLLDTLKNIDAEGIDEDDIMYPPPLEELEDLEETVRSSRLKKIPIKSEEVEGEGLSGSEDYEDEPEESVPKRRRRTSGRVGRRKGKRVPPKDQDYEPRVCGKREKQHQQSITSFLESNDVTDPADASSAETIPKNENIANEELNSQKDEDLTDSEDKTTLSAYDTIDGTDDNLRDKSELKQEVNDAEDINSSGPPTLSPIEPQPVRTVKTPPKRRNSRRKSRFIEESSDDVNLPPVLERQENITMTLVDDDIGPPALDKPETIQSPERSSRRRKTKARSDEVDGKGLSGSDGEGAQSLEEKTPVLRTNTGGTRGRPKRKISPARDEDYTPRRRAEQKKVQTPITNFVKSSNVTCARCNEEMTANNWSKHCLSKHNNLAWRVGEEALDLDDEAALKRILNKAKKRKPTFICEKCNEGKKSVVGFISHIKFCGKTDEEKFSLMWTCPLCHGSFMPSSREYHERTHREGNVTKKKETVVEDVLDCRGKRKAAEKAVTKIQEFTDLVKGTEEPPAAKKRKLSSRIQQLIHFPEAAKRIPNVWRGIWFKSITNGQTAKCRQPGCDFSTNDLQTICAHYRTCNFTPAMALVCKLCKFMTESKADIELHIKEAHATEIGAEDPDFDASEDSEEDGDFDITDDIDGQKNRRKPTGPPPRLPPADRPIFIKGLTDNLIPNTSFTTALKWTMEFYEKHYRMSLFEDLHVNPFTLVTDPDAYLPELKTSMKYTQKSTNMKITKTKTWKKLDRFEADVANDVLTIFTGGPVWALAWLPIPSIAYKDEPNQYLAVSTHPKMTSTYELGESYAFKNSIQIWDMGRLVNTPIPSSRPQIPKLSYIIAHEAGTAWALEWCPSGTYGQERMGLLAAAMSSGQIYIYSLPFPETINLPESPIGPRVLKTNPVVILHVNSLLEDEEGSNMQVMCLNWSRISDHDEIVAGFSNGFIAIWNLKIDNPLLRRIENNTIHLDATHHFYGHGHAVIFVTIVPIDGKRYIASSSTDRTSKLWDIEKLQSPIWCLKKGAATNAVWLTHWPTMLTVYDDVYAWRHTQSYLTSIRDPPSTVIPMLPTNSPCFAAATSDWLNGICHGSLSGDIIAMFPPQLLHLRDIDKACKRRWFVSNVELIDFEPEIKPKKDESGLTLYHYGPGDYKCCADKFGIIFHDDLDNKRGTTWLNRGDRKSYLSTETTTPWPLEQYPFASVNRIAWNSNAWSFLWMASGYQNGLIRIVRFQKMSNTSIMNDLLSKHAQFMMNNNDNNPIPSTSQ